MDHPILIRIQDTVVSSDLITTFFCCDLEACHGDCCVEGDAGAPLSRSEADEIRKALPAVEDSLTPAARRVIEEQGIAYRDPEGELVTSIVEGGPCVFTLFRKDGLCLCALEAAHREGKCSFCKPASCALYPVRLKEFDTFTAVNLHSWKICRPALAAGRKKGIRAYEFLRGPLISRFGQEWYDELCLTAREFLSTDFSSL